MRARLACVRTLHNRAYRSTVDACGLRWQEALYLEVSDIDRVHLSSKGQEEAGGRINERMRVVSILRG